MKLFGNHPDLKTPAKLAKLLETALQQQARLMHRMFRSRIYQRAEEVTDTVPFGTQIKVYPAHHPPGRVSTSQRS